ncbi:unnamed protein product [Acanthoscelides obtectus]|uniref:Major facilitator superfamily (MFS) profile domain-containing protein n=1 Tax=Acanthoscelides obtectus TaxID=200917 RepID=A0A9P0KHK3_ACAOB|nr:unnamed protein product [Acanthoscelides obtectus]CAK1664781.1 Facilitated trehalose transporter Tret1 [Acanthoscelides obtectus]
MLGCTEKTRKLNLYVYASAVAVNLTLLSSSTTVVWTSPVIPQLQSNDPDVNPLGKPITPLEESLIGGLPYIGGMIVPLMMGKLCDLIGRKRTLLLIILLHLVFFGILAFAKTLYLYYITRTILGGLFFYALTVNNIYNSEIAEDSNRGIIYSTIVLFHVSGFPYGYITGFYLPVKAYTLVCTVPMILSFILILFVIPESPYYLAKTNETQAAEVLRKLRNKDDVSKDLDVIKATIEAVSNSNKKANWGMLLTDPLNRKATLICFGAMFLQEASGIPAIIAFSGPIFNSVGLSGNFVSVLLGMVRSFVGFITIGLVGKCGKRLLMLVSTSGCAVAMLITGIYFYLENIGFQGIESYVLIPVICVILFMCSYGIGLGIGCVALQGELFPDDMKNAGVSVVNIWGSFLCFAVTFGFPLIAYYLGMYWPFLLFGIVSASGIVFTYCFFPNTEGKSFLEIQETLRGNIRKS